MTRLVTALATLACAPTRPTDVIIAPPPETYAERIAAAEALTDTGAWQRALRLTDALITDAPDRPQAYLARGRALAVADRLDGSAEAYERAYALGERSRRLYAELTSIHDMLRRYDDAERLYREYLGDHRDDTEMRQQLALTLMLRGRPNDAVAELKKLYDPNLASPDMMAIAEDLALAHFQAEHFGETERLVNDIVTREPKRPVALRLLAELAVRRTALTQALAFAEQAVSVAPNDAAARRLRAQLRLALGDAQGALEDYRVLWHAGSADTGVLLGLAGSLILTGDLAQAEAALARARTLGVTSPTLVLREAQLRRRRGDPKALADIEAFAREHPTSLDVWQELLVIATDIHDREREKRARAELRALGVVADE